jgi:hypothetical protein
MLWPKRGAKPAQIPAGSAKTYGKISLTAFDEELASGYLCCQGSRCSRIDKNESPPSLESAAALTSTSD